MVAEAGPALCPFHPVELGALWGPPCSPGLCYPGSHLLPYQRSLLGGFISRVCLSALEKRLPHVGSKVKSTYQVCNRDRKLPHVPAHLLDIGGCLHRVSAFPDGTLPFICALGSLQPRAHKGQVNRQEKYRVPLLEAAVYC